ncbi:MAG: putative AlkP superfamily phosphohydrolase/phosphomutase [Pseudohongiellaceae bacterium]|jgi:predicted AlkP superfamily phosphohydrolase/phosphomutase
MTQPLRSRVFPTLLVLAGALACGDSQSPKIAEPLSPVFVLGIDGLEWSVLRPLMEEGRCPNLRGLMERGCFGKLGTFIPTHSPVIWTTVATGKPKEEHGIEGFVDRKGRVYTSSRRRGAALWNIADAYGLTSNVFGWWVTWPVEPVAGVMVSATSASSMIDKNWKPALMPGLDDQVHPPELNDRVLALAEQVGAVDIIRDLASAKVFGELPAELLTDVERDLIQQSLWSIQSDETYFRLALDLLPDHKADLGMLYFGGTDVVGHRFWRHYEPEAYAWSGSSPELDQALAGVIPRYYEWVDAMVGELLPLLEGTNIIVCSDHGMHAISTQRDNDRHTTGDHQDGAPGVLIVAGPDIRSQGGVERWVSNGALAPVGQVTDVAPTVLALLGIPPGRNMRGRVLVNLLKPEARATVEALGRIESHDEGFRDPVMTEMPAEKNADFVKRMAELGYFEGGVSSGDATRPVNPDTFVPDKTMGPGGTSGGGADGAGG